MKPLLNIRSVPISIEHKSTRAALKYNAQQPTVNIARQRGGLDIKTDPARIRMDSTEMRNSMGLKSPQRFTSDFAETGHQDALKATQSFAEEGNSIVDSKGKGSPIADIAMSRSIRTYETALTFIPSTGPEMRMEGGTVSFQYAMDKLTFDWNVSTRPFLEYVPPNIEFTVTQYPEVIIEYLGGPIYAPPSADPNYEPPRNIDVNA